jgi:predicted glycogen debranching enzyme
MEFGKSHWRTFDRGIEKEWLLTNGIGGFASSTIIGANTRRYHGLLVASLNPPVERHLVVSKIDESILIDGRSYNLYAFSTNDFIMEGYQHLQRVVIDEVPTFIYSVEDMFIEKTVCMVHGENTVYVLYHVFGGQKEATLKLAPLVNFRDYHHNSYKSHMRFAAQIQRRGVSVRPHDFDIDISIQCDSGIFIREDDCWFMNMEYAVERERGLQSTEDHYIPGHFEVMIEPGEDKYITVIATIERTVQCMNGIEIIKKEKKRVKQVLDTAGYKDSLAERLVKAADDFIVYRKSTNAKTIIAGYPWFTDWGRDTMIAFTGLTLSTKRFDDAKQIIYTFSKNIKYGLLPNVFPDGGQQPAYNTVDAALWYFEAVLKYLKYTEDYAFIREDVYEGLKSIISAYSEGTLFNIKMDEDGLITAGDVGTQLTWMDAKVGDWVVTPRHGKAVEVNALWYNALKIMGELAAKFGEDASIYEDKAQLCRNSFINSFWNDEMQCLYDVIGKDFKDDKVRSNQVLALSLAYPVLEGELAKMVVRKVWKELYTAYGLRSLSRESDEYRGIYIGDPYSRDGAYHQGTVWAWPLGHFISGFLKTFGYTEENKRMALRFIKPFEHHLYDACVGSISEIFDGNEPLMPRGSFAQAWSVGEVLRAYVEDIGVS